MDMGGIKILARDFTWWGTEWTCMIQYGIGMTGKNFSTHGDALTWMYVPNYWPFVRGIHQWLVDSPHKGPVIQIFDVLFVVKLNKQLNCYWFEMPQLCHVTVWYNMWSILYAICLSWMHGAKMNLQMYKYPITMLQCTKKTMLNIFSCPPFTQHDLAIHIGQFKYSNNKKYIAISSIQVYWYTPQIYIHAYISPYP